MARKTQISGKGGAELNDPFILILFFPFSPADITVIAVIPDHLLTFARDMGGSALADQPL
jgi:hypothetical protein